MAEKEDGIGFILRKITTEQFAIIESSYKSGSEIDLKVGLGFGINFSNNIISVLFSTTLIQEEAPFLILEVGCHFNVADKAWRSFYDKSKTGLIVPKEFMSHLVVLTIGTARGVLHVKTESSPFNEFLLPTLNVTELVKKDVPFSVEN